MATTLNPALIALIEKLGAALRPRPKKPNATEDERRAEVLTDDDGSGYAMTHDRRPARKRDGQRI